MFFHQMIVVILQDTFPLLHLDGTILSNAMIDSNRKSGKFLFDETYKLHNTTAIYTETYDLIT
jgi:hypothetical protein